jgi:hypothetical protein
VKLATATSVIVSDGIGLEPILENKISLDGECHAFGGLNETDFFGRQLGFESFFAEIALIKKLHER